MAEIRKSSRCCDHEAFCKSFCRLPLSNLSPRELTEPFWSCIFPSCTWGGGGCVEVCPCSEVIHSQQMLVLLQKKKKPSGYICFYSPDDMHSFHLHMRPRANTFVYTCTHTHTHTYWHTYWLSTDLLALIMVCVCACVCHHLRAFNIMAVRYDNEASTQLGGVALKSVPL